MNKKIFLLMIILIPIFIFSSDQSSSDDRFENGIDRESFSYQLLAKVGQATFFVWDTARQITSEIYHELKSPKKVVQELARVVFTVANGPVGKEYDELISDFEKNISLK